MKKKTKTILIVGVGLLAATGAAFAAKGIEERKQFRSMFSPQKIFERVDANNDSAITLEELNLAADAQFVRADQNGDSSIAKADVVAAIDSAVQSEKIKRHSGKFTDRLFTGMDIDLDGSITKTELSNRLAKFHALADWNDDGRVEIAELKRLRASMPGRWGKRRDRNKEDARSAN